MSPDWCKTTPVPAPAIRFVSTVVLKSANKAICLDISVDRTISIVIRRNIWRCLRFNDDKKSDFDSCKRRKAAAKWCCSKTDSSFFAKVQSTQSGTQKSEDFPGAACRDKKECKNLKIFPTLGAGNFFLLCYGPVTIGRRRQEHVRTLGNVGGVDAIMYKDKVRRTLNKANATATRA
uniref:Uncharacterized protein n=1 Tax=Romanomermis culicivorax TaxID=13658 RepID=A0A915I9V1_ROMCU